MSELKNILSILDVETLQQDAEEQKSQTKTLSLEEIRKYGDDMEELSLQKEHLENQAAELSKQITHIATKILPEALQSLGLQGITLSSGSSIELMEIISASVNDENREMALSWLRNNGFADIIKNDINVSFGKDEDIYAQKLLSFLEEARRNDEIRCGSVDQKETVHAGTLKSFIKNQLREGLEIPLDTFNVSIHNLVKFKEKKRRY